MDFRIADIFVDRLARLTGEEQKRSGHAQLDSFSGFLSV